MNEEIRIAMTTSDITAKEIRFVVHVGSDRQYSVKVPQEHAGKFLEDMGVQYVEII